MEIWKDICGYEGFYQVSNTGKIRSLDRITVDRNGKRCFRKGKELVQIPNSKGYMRIMLSDNKSKKRFFVHRIVALHFVNNVDKVNNNIVNHIDSNYRNNSADNLEWTTLKGNSQHALKNGRTKRTKRWLDNLHRSQTKYYRPVEAYDENGDLVIRFKNLNECKKMGYEPSSVCQCCKGIRKTHKNLSWKYAKIESGDADA